jgi:predicted outer membrane protein
MGARVGVAVGALGLAAFWSLRAGAIPVPPPADAGADSGPLVVQATPQPEQAHPPGVPPEKPPPTMSMRVLMASDRPTLQRLHDGNQLQARMGRLAQERGAARAIKALGRKLAADHVAADKKLDAYLRKRGSSLSELASTTSADADHELLATRAGAEFDRTFSLQIVADHRRTIEMLQSARIATFDDVLRDFYDELIETEEAHKRAAQDVIPSLAKS